MPSPSEEHCVVRAAREDDIPVLGQFGTRLMALHHQWDPRRFIQARSGTVESYTRWLAGQLPKKDVVILVAERKEAILGYSYAALEGFDYMALRGPAGMIHDMFVDPDERKQGIGRRLLDATVAALADKGASQVLLSTAYVNETAQRLFSSVGFRPTMIEMTRTLDKEETTKT